jgi:hypothetical protein
MVGFLETFARLIWIMLIDFAREGSPDPVHAPPDLKILPIIIEG